MKVGLGLNFNKASKNGIYFRSLYEDFVKFDPYSFFMGNNGKGWNAKKHLNDIKRASNSDEIGVFDKQGNSFSIGATRSRHPHQSIFIEQDVSTFLPSNVEIESLVNYPDSFVSAYLYNVEYVFVHSNPSNSTYLHKNIAKEILDSVKNTPYSLGVFGDKRYDIKFNPGRKILISYTWLMIGWKMWFGPEFFKLVPKKTILSFPYATEIKELSNNILYVQLYDNILEPHTVENVFRQWKWREWLNYDELEKRYG